MRTLDYLKILVEDIHSTVIATVDEDGKPFTRVIDLMMYDAHGLYFITAKGKAFYQQLKEQQYISLSSVKGKCSISLHGKIRSIDHEKLEEIFEKNTYMKDISPGDTKAALEVFQLYEASGEFFDISNPKNVTRESITIGSPVVNRFRYIIEKNCIGCGRCQKVCPQKCIEMKEGRAVIIQRHCLHCGNCKEICPVGAVSYR